MWTQEFSIYAEELMTSAQNTIDHAVHEMERMFQRIDGIKLVKTKGSFPKVRIAETEDKYTIRATVPGYSREQIEVVTPADNAVAIRLAKREADDSLVNEIPSYACTRTMIFPKPIKAEEITAKLENGILYLEVPKVAEPKEETKETKIEIN